MIEAGAAFPDFSLPDQEGNPVSLSDLKGHKAVIYFYPKADTPGCTKEACSFRDALPQFQGVKVIGVSADPIKAQKKFGDKFQLPFPLLADEDHALAEAAGVWVEKSMYGKKYFGVERATFLLDENGVVARVWPKVKVDGHADEVLAALK